MPITFEAVTSMQGTDARDSGGSLSNPALMLTKVPPPDGDLPLTSSTSLDVKS